MNTKIIEKSNFIKTKNKIVVRDLDGNVLFEKENLVVLRGRVFALEKMFMEQCSEAPSNYLNNVAAGKICLFACGKGGAPNSQLFEPYVPSPLDETSLSTPFGLKNPVPFRTVDSTVPITAFLSGGSIDEPHMYYCGVEDLEDPAVTRYYYKTFDQPIEWVYDKDTNEVYVICTLKIDVSDFRNTKSDDNLTYVRSEYINELGLFIATYSSGANTYSNVEMVTHICFDSEPFKNMNKTLLIDYYVYA